MKSFSHLKIKGFSDCHCQGIAIDNKREYMYFSFTTSLIKTDLQGNIVGSVKGIIGHLGCLAFNNEDGKVYASLEYKNDSVGKGILCTVDSDAVFSDSFYVAVFDVDKITCADMDAQKDDIMKAVYLKEAVNDYSFKGHKYGCSGIDGITFAPAPGEKEGSSLYVAYGIYGDTKRKDNDYQILLRYDMNDFCSYAKAINQNELHRSGPEKISGKYFVYTGNTTYGIQNLEYDKDNNCLFAAVYKGKKLRFPNFSMFAIDIDSTATVCRLKGLSESTETLPLKRIEFFSKRGSISGCNFVHGSTGMISLGNGCFLFSEEFKDENGHGTDICSYKLYPGIGFVKEEILL